jgi:flagellar basal-body rod protein FlgG
MSGLLESASAILALQAKRLEVAGHNVANATTTGYKSESMFAEAISQNTRGTTVAHAHGLAATVPDSLDALPTAEFNTDLSQGKLTQTNNPFDLAVASSGFFQVSTATGVAYTRQGQFHLDENGRFLSPQGWVLQGQGGGDLSVRSKNFTIQPDGTVIEDNRPTGRIGLYDLNQNANITRASGGALLASGAAPAETDNPQIKQGYLEASNVDTAADMVHLIESVRLSESAQKLILTYDDLLGRALTTIGQLQ